MNAPNNTPWPKRVVLDFDGVVHQAITPWTTPEVIPDPPVDYAFKAIEEYVQGGYRVSIHSGRSVKIEARRAMMEWFLKQGMSPQLLEHLDFPDHKPNADLYIDDKGFQFRGTFPTVEYIDSYRPWNRV